MMVAPRRGIQFLVEDFKTDENTNDNGVSAERKRVSCPRDGSFYRRSNH
jgi:hypothetical protein